MPLDPIPGQELFDISDAGIPGMARCTLLAFDTVVTVIVPDGPGRDGVLLEVRDRCRVYERLFSRTLPHSDIARINAAGGQPVEVSLETHALIEAALGYCADGEGLFDITVAPASRLWDFKRGIMPDGQALSEAVSHVGWRLVELGRGADGAPLVRLADPLAGIDLGGIAKGYIADRLAELLDARGLGSFLVNLGGNVYARGRKPDGSPWTVGIRDPRRRDALVGAVELEDASAVTSGIYERCFARDGVLYHHVLHPLTGLPVATDLAGATVVARRSIDAEGYSTTLLALGLERARAFVQARPQIEAAYLVDAQGALVKVNRRAAR